MKKEKNLGQLIDLSQIKYGPELLDLLTNYNNLDKNVQYQLKVGFSKKFEDLSKKYKTLHEILQGDITKIELDENFKSALAELTKKVEDNYVYSEATYVKKGKVTLDDLDEKLKQKLYKILGEDEGNMVDSKGNLRKIRWQLYFVLFGDKIIYMDDIKNKSMTDDKEVTKDDWYGENSANKDYSGNNVELWAYDSPAESYLPLYKAGYVSVPSNATYNSSMTYYTRTVNGYVLWTNANNTWETDKSSLYYFDEIVYENALIDELEKSNYSKTYVKRRITGYNETVENENTRIEPVCGTVSYNAPSGRFTFDNVAMTRYVFKLVKYAE